MDKFFGCNLCGAIWFGKDPFCPCCGSKRVRVFGDDGMPNMRTVSVLGRGSNFHRLSGRFHEAECLVCNVALEKLVEGESVAR